MGYYNYVSQGANNNKKKVFDIGLLLASNETKYTND